MRPSSILMPLIVSALALAQEYNPATLLAITSPENGTIVSPGERLVVTITSASVRDAELAVISPLGMSGLVSSLPGRVPYERLAERVGNNPRKDPPLSEVEIRQRPKQRHPLSALHPFATRLQLVA
jgi:hypothetical protein